MTRIEERAGFAVPVRVRLLEGDGDRQDKVNEQIATELAGIRKILTGLLTAVLVAMASGIAAYALQIGGK